MKTPPVVTALLFSLPLLSQASMTTTWTGEGDDPANGADSANWTDGAPNRSDGEGPSLIFNKGGDVLIETGVPDTSDGGSITVTNLTDVTIKSGRWTGDVTVELGSALTMNQVDFKNSAINLDGVMSTLSAAGNDSDASYNTFNMGTEGRFNVNGALWGSSHFTLNALLGTEDSTMLTGSYRIETRTLIDTVNGFYGGAVVLGTFSAADGVNLSAIDSAMTGDASDYVGQYYVFTENNDLKVQYVVSGTGNIPEPATATLSLLALAGLVARRRRK